MKNFKKDFIIKTKIDKTLAIRLAMTINDEENLKYVSTLISCIEDNEKLKLFIQAVLSKDLLKSKYYKQAITLIFMENDINTLNYLVNTLCNSTIINSACYETILKLIDSSKKYTTYILVVAEGLITKSQNGISPNAYKKIMNLDKNLVIRLIITINKYKNKEKIINIISQIVLKSLDINTIEYNLNVLLDKLEEILLIDDPDSINVILNLILKQINESTKEKINLSLPNKIRVIDNNSIKQIKFVG